MSRTERVRNVTWEGDLHADGIRLRAIQSVDTRHGEDRSLTTKHVRGSLAKELYTTGVAGRFHVVYDELVSDCVLVEHKLHSRFARFRENKGAGVSSGYRSKTHVRALREEAMSFLVSESALKNRCEILTKLQCKFPKCLARRPFPPVAIIQLADLILLEDRDVGQARISTTNWSSGSI